MVVDSILIGVPILVGMILGILEGIFVYEDENMTNMHQAFADILHGFIFATIGTLIACNVPYFLNFKLLPGFIESILFIDEQGISLTVCIVITLIMMIKMVASHAIKGISNNGFSEKLWHKLSVAGGVGFSPYYVIPLIATISPYVPSWLPL